MTDVTLYVCDAQWVFDRAVTQNKYDAVPANSTMVEPPATTGNEVAQWNGRGWTVLPERPVPPAPPQPTQFELDQRRYQKRAAVQSELIAWMAADNMSRVRSGAWTVADLTSLMSDPAVTAAQAYMSTLSYELAAQAIQTATTPLLTQAIKDVWISKLTEHFYLEV